MMSTSLVELVAALPNDQTWGPPTTTESLMDGVPYAPYSKGDKLGRMADFTHDGKDREGRGGRAFNRNFRDLYSARDPKFMTEEKTLTTRNTNRTDQQVYGAGTSSLFTVQVAEDESTFSVVDNTKTPKTRIFGRGGRGFAGRGRGAREVRGGRGTFQNARVGGHGGQQAYGYDPRGRGGRGGARRFGWKDYDKPQRNRDSSVTIKSDWIMLEEIDFSRLQKLSLDAGAGDDVDSYGFLHYYDRSYDKAPVKNTERKLNVVDRVAYNVTTSSDPVIQELAEKNEATIFATDSILSMLMCSPRSVYSWDLVITRQDDKIYLDKRDGSSVDMVSVNENAADAPLEASEGNKDTINFPGALALEATFINHNFANQTVTENDAAKVEMNHENPFYNPAEETEPLASKAYKYRRFDLSLEKDDQPLHMIVRTEIDAMVKNNITGEDQMLTLKALNEFDHKAQGAGGALDWRTKLVSQRGAVVATEMKNNSCKLARWATQAIVASADVIKLGFVSRMNPKVPDRHVILGVVGYDPRKFAEQMNLNLNNGWGIVRSIIDMVRGMKDGRYVLVKDPNKQLLRLYSVPISTFDEADDEDDEPIVEAKEETK